VSLFKRILIILAATVGVMLLAVMGVVVAIRIYDAYGKVQVAQFYKAHPMLRSMIETQPVATSGVDPWPQMRVVLLERVPIGSARSEAVRILADESMVCTAINTPTRKSLACSLPDDPVGVPRWHVEVNFDEHDKVAEGRVLPLKGRLL
jgi:hypothetical protein